MMLGPLQLVNIAGVTKRIVLTNIIGQGATCRVYKLEGDPAKVVKLLHADEARRQEQKIRAMLLNPPMSTTIDHNGTSYTELVWPQELVYEGDTFRGFTMPALDRDTTFQLHNLFTSRDRADAGIRQDYFFRFHVCLNLAKVVANLHESKHYLIDFKPENVWVHRDTGFVVPLDTDGFSVFDGDSARHPARHYTPQYIAPEAHFTANQNQQAPQSMGEAQDRFALGVLLFQLLNEGIHPYQGEPRAGHIIPNDTQTSIDANLYSYGLTPNSLQRPRSNSVHTHFDKKTRQLFDRCFTNPTGRPSADEWALHLEMLHPKTGSTPLLTCSRNSTHVRFPGLRCAYCARGTITMPHNQQPAPPPLRQHTIAPIDINWRAVGLVVGGLLLVGWLVRPGGAPSAETAAPTAAIYTPPGSKRGAELSPQNQVTASEPTVVGSITRWEEAWGIARVSMTGDVRAGASVYCDNVNDSTTRLELLAPKEGTEIIAAQIAEGAACSSEAPLRSAP